MSREPRSAFDDAVRILVRRGHGRGELTRKLEQRGHSSADIGSAFERLNELGYLEPEAELALRYARELSQKKGSTPRATREKLRARGFEEGTTENAIKEAFSNWDPRVAALETVQTEIDAHKAARRLSRRGFPSDVIAWVVDQLER